MKSENADGKKWLEETLAADRNQQKESGHLLPEVEHLLRAHFATCHCINLVVIYWSQWGDDLLPSNTHGVF